MAFSCSAASTSEDPDPAGDRPERAHRGEDVELGGVVPGTQPQRGRNDSAGGQTTEAAADLVGGGDDQGVQLALAVGGGLDRGLARGEQDLQRRPLRAGTWLREMGACQGVPCRANRVDRVGLRAGPAGGSGGAVELDDELVTLGEMCGQSGAVAAGAFHRPRAQLSVLVGQFDQGVVAARIRGHGGLRQHRAGGRGEHGRGVGVFVGVDANDDLDLLCEHGQLRSPDRGGRGLRSGSGDSAGL
jgi:hypothetical protein